MKRFIHIFIPCALLAFVAVLLLSSCGTQHYIKKSKKDLTKLCAKDSAEAAKVVALFFPVKTSVKVVTRTIKGKTDTLEYPVAYYVDCDSAITATLDEASRKHVKCPDCPPLTVRVDTNVVEIVKVVENDIYRLPYEKALKQLQSSKDNTHVWRSRALWTWGIELLLIVLLVAYLWIKHSDAKLLEKFIEKP